MKKITLFLALCAIAISCRTAHENVHSPNILESKNIAEIERFRKHPTPTIPEEAF
uniref:Uncharacterized protein n=1 Tax=Chryseobacterium endophyticum TaxID=1854762 RepID=A0AAU6WRU0_9FLAO